MLYQAVYVAPDQSPPARSIVHDPALARYVQNWGTQVGDVGLVAVCHGVPAGAAWMRLFTAAEPGYGFVNELTPELSIAMLPEHRGKGIGSMLLEQLLKDVPVVSLSCDPANPA